MVRLWLLFKGGEIRGKFVGMGSGGAIHGRTPGHLPDEGGTLQQPAVMLDAFAWMSEVEAVLAEPTD